MEIPSNLILVTIVNMAMTLTNLIVPTLSTNATTIGHEASLDPGETSPQAGMDPTKFRLEVPTHKPKDINAAVMKVTSHSPMK